MVERLDVVESARLWPDRCCGARRWDEEDLVLEVVPPRDEEPLREEDERELVEERELEDEREEEDVERPGVECERVPRRVDSSDVTARLPRSSLSDRTHRAVIRWRR